MGRYNATHSTLEDKPIVAVPILRAGNSFMKELMELIPDVQLGQILIQRKEDSKEKEAELFYSKLPILKDKSILLVDPMIGTGG